MLPAGAHHAMRRTSAAKYTSASGSELCCLTEESSPESRTSRGPGPLSLTGLRRTHVRGRAWLQRRWPSPFSSSRTQKSRFLRSRDASGWTGLFLSSVYIARAHTRLLWQHAAHHTVTRCHLLQHAEGSAHVHTNTKTSTKHLSRIFQARRAA